MELDQLNVINKCIGQTLTAQEISNLEMGLLKRQANEKLMSIKFWGKIYATKGDYVIATALIKDTTYPQKKFFFCTNTSPELQQFPQIDAKKREKANAMKGQRLTGDPSQPLEEVEEPEDGTEYDPFREVDRLVLMVEEIDTIIAVVPCSSYLMASSHQVTTNPSFEGLSWEKASQLDNYYHLRLPQDKERQAIVKSDGLIRTCDFLDPITMDLEGSWTLSTDNTHTTTILRNLLYPGAVSFHLPRTTKYGFVYFGDGIKNEDLAFML